MSLCARNVLLVLASAMLLSAGQAGAAMIRVSQESGSGMGDFDSNILGRVVPIQTDLSAVEFYGWGQPPLGSYSGAVPNLLKDTSNLFFVDSAVDGLCVFIVHDSIDKSGGWATMYLQLDGDDASILVQDDPFPADVYLPFGQGVVTNNAWLRGHTDGLAAGSLDGDWSLYASFSFRLGLKHWKVYSADSDDRLSLSMDLGRVVRFDLEQDAQPAPEMMPEPLTMVGLAGGVGFMARYLRRRRD